MPTLGEFQPAAPLDHRDPRIQGALVEALARVRTGLGGHATGHAGGRELTGGGVRTSTNPARHDEVVGTFADATAADVDAAVAAAWQAFGEWRSVSDQQRTDLLLRVAEGLRRTQSELAALVLLETGKTWDEALGEVAESIDFLAYHAHQLQRLRERETEAVYPHPREQNRYRYVPLGAGVAVPPWPFPIAQFVGMVSAAVVTGNTVIVKPASAAPITSRRVFDIWREAGTPDGVVNLLFGAGASVGHALVTHRDTRFVSLTGAAATGTRVGVAASADHPTRRWFTRLILELGLKNSVLVDETADLEAAAAAVVAGAFSFQGQKCSAGSRLVAVDGIHDRLVELVVARAEALTIGDPAEFTTQFGPLIDHDAVMRAQAFIGVGRSEGWLATGGEHAPIGEAFIRPTVFTELPRSSTIARQEVMAPILAVLRCRDVDDGYAIVNDSPGGLTGSFFSSDEGRLAEAADHLHVGSLYLNRKPTASEVGFHPFGGFGLAGTDAKAGGPDYLLQYVQAQTITRAW